MPLNRRNTKNFTRVLRAGVNLQKIILYHRGDDQKQGTVVAIPLYGCWRNETLSKTGETMRGPMAVESRVTWNIPRAELERVGVPYINVTDKIYDPIDNYWWEPFNNDRISEHLMGSIIELDCHQTDPS